MNQSFKSFGLIFRKYIYIYPVALPSSQFLTQSRFLVLSLKKKEKRNKTFHNGKSKEKAIYKKTHEMCTTIKL